MKKMYNTSNIPLKDLEIHEIETFIIKICDLLKKKTDDDYVDYRSQELLMFYNENGIDADKISQLIIGLEVGGYAFNKNLIDCVGTQDIVYCLYIEHYI